MSGSKDFKAILEALEDHIFETHRLCDIKEIAERTGMSKEKCKNILDILVRQNQVYVAFQSRGQGSPNIYIPRYMMDEILTLEKKPKWLKDYSFEEKEKINKKIAGEKQKILGYDMFERLLYGTDIPLEEAVAYSLEWLEFENVVHHKEEDRDIQDIDFLFKNEKYLLEVKGIGKAAKKDAVEELNGWRKAEALSEENKNKKLKCILVVNHYRYDDPASRQDPLTEHAKKWLEMYKFRFIKTTSIFEIIKSVLYNNLSKNEGKKRFLEGDNIE